VLGGSASFDVSGALGGAMGVLVVARTRVDLPLHGGILHPDPLGFSLVHTVSGLPGDPGVGGFSHSFAIPPTASLRGTSFFAQALYLDPAAPRRVSFTPGLRVTLY
jgi:hypothetical protein